MKQKEIDNIHDKIRNPLTIIQLELTLPDTNREVIKKQVERINEFLKSLESDKEGPVYYSLLRITLDNQIEKVETFGSSTEDKLNFANKWASFRESDNLYVESSISDEIISLIEFLNTTSNT